MPPIEIENFPLATRDGLPEELMRLRHAHPRESWAGHANLGEWVRFWLDRHDMFRQVSEMIEDGCEKLGANAVSVAEFTPWFIPRARFLIGHLDLHHRIEEAHIFPAFARAEPAMVQGFDLLEADHRAIHELTDELQNAAMGLAALSEGDGTDAASVTGNLAELLPALSAHLTDEEDLIVPIVLERGEMAIGLF